MGQVGSVLSAGHLHGTSHTQHKERQSSAEICENAREQTLTRVHACSLPTLITISAAIGSAASVAFGGSSQLVARFPPSSGQALALGIVSSGPLVLLLQFLLALGPHPTAMQQIMFFHIASLFPLASLVFAVWLLRRYWEPLQAGNILLPFARTIQAPGIPSTHTLTHSHTSPALTRPQSNTNLWATLNNTANVQSTQQAPSAPLVPAQSLPPDEGDAESMIVGNLSMPDIDCDAQDPFNCWGSMLQPASCVPGAVSATTLADNASAPLLAANSALGSGLDGLHAPLLSMGALTDLATAPADMSRHPLLASAPIMGEWPWSPTASVPEGGGPAQAANFLENVAAHEGAQIESEPLRVASLSSQYVNDIAGERLYLCFKKNVIPFDPAAGSCVRS